MKCLKTLGLAAVTAMAVMAFIGASSASATIFCKTPETTGCTAGWIYLAGTAISASLDSGTSAILKTTGGLIENTCTTSTMEGSMANAGGATETVRINIEASRLTFSNCSNTTDVLEGGELEVHWISGTDNGTVTAKHFKVTMLLAGITCTYTAGTETDIGTLTTGRPATIDINAVVTRSAGGFACPSTTIWEAKYTVTSPTPLYISEG